MAKRKKKGQANPHAAQSGTNNLAFRFPSVAAEWHPTRNGGKSPAQFAPFSNKKMWWLCHKGHEWQDVIAKRTARGKQCPYCSDRRIWAEYNLETKYPAVAAEWHPNKNRDIKPDQVMPGSGLKAWWVCERGHEYEARVSHRTYSGSSCPFCAGQRLAPDNSLAARFPEFVAEWHPARNGNLKPMDVLPGTARKVWWKCRNGHSWEASVNSRTNMRSGCPYCVGRVVGSDNNLAARYPAIALEWHPTKNGDATPGEFLPGSNNKVWWKCAQEHEWQAVIASRTAGNRCPYCSRKRASEGTGSAGAYNLAVEFPEIASEWHPTRNSDLLPHMLTPFSGRKVWWRCQHGHEWMAAVSSRSYGTGCPMCRPRFSLAQIRLYCELKSIFTDCELEHRLNGISCDVFIPRYKAAVEYDGAYWHREAEKRDLNKNVKLGSIGVAVFRAREPGLSPLSERDVVLDVTEVSVSVVKSVLERFLAYLPLNEEHEQRTSTYLQRTKFCNTAEYRRLASFLPGPPPEKSLAGQYPGIALEWHPEKNAPLTADKVTSHSGRIFWWKCVNGHYWKAAVYMRVNGTGCPYCSGNRPSEDYNLLVKFPNVAKEWDSEKNGDLKPEHFTPRSHKKIWWKCQHGHQWKAHISSRTGGYGCPYCAGLHATPDNNIAVLYPELAKEFHPDKNGPSKPSDFTPHSSMKIWWKCNQGHEWASTVSNRVKGSGCPYCSGRCATPSNNLSVAYPEIAEEWHPRRNGTLIPEQFKSQSNKKVWWQCHQGHEWEAVIYSRTGGTGCPYCSGNRPSSDHNLLVNYPDIAGEWHPTRNDGVTPDEVKPGSGRKVWWKCANGHEWETAVANRTQGAGCPYCSGNRATEANNLAVNFPKLAEQLHPTKNKGIDPSVLKGGSGKKVWWKCDCGHEWQTSIQRKTSGGKCPRCKKSI